MGSNVPHILLVNPWIHDFAAYDVWARPLGLLHMATMLRDSGCRVSWLDCLDRFHPRLPESDPTLRQGRGPYPKVRIPKPAVFVDVPRRFRRYGIDPDWFRDDLKNVGRPDVVLVTSFMTYWYTGVAETIAVIREIWPHAPVILGGVYASLLPDHARSVCGADEVVVGDGASVLADLLERHLGWRGLAGQDLNRFTADIRSWPRPALELQRKIAYAPLLTSTGCPFRCAYCAGHFLQPRRYRRDPDAVVEEILYWRDQYGVRDMAFYDDALLVDADRHIIPILEGVLRRVAEREPTVRFHTPNAVHLREITPKLADLMFRAGFHTLRVGLETTAFDARADLDRKVTEEEFHQAVARLRAAGFGPDRLGAYLLAGLPGWNFEGLKTSIRVVRGAGVRPIPAWYTPIPGTALWSEAVAGSRYDLASDPLLTNNAIFPCVSGGFSWEMVTEIKRWTQGE